MTVALIMVSGEDGNRRKLPKKYLLDSARGQEYWCDGGISDLHPDTKGLFIKHDILEASCEFFENKILIIDLRELVAADTA